MSKHTSGPWRANSAMQVVRGWNYSDHVVATVSAQLLWHENRNKEQEEVDANARLIAAAPELYDELRTLALVANSVAYCFEHNPSNFAAALNDMRECAKSACAALAKAKGEA